MKRLIYQRASGEVTVVVPGLAGKRLESKINEYMNAGLTREAAEQAYLESVKARRDEIAQTPTDKLHGATFIGYEYESEIPQREFRNQWRIDGGKIKVDPALETEERWVRIRRLRDEKLKDSDGKMLKAQEKEEKVKEWKDYREALRNLTDQPDPKNIVWPVEP